MSSTTKIADDIERASRPLVVAQQELEKAGVADVAIGCCLMAHALTYLETSLEAKHMAELRTLLVQSQERITALLTKHDK